MKNLKLISFALALMMLAAYPFAVFAEKGDVDGDGSITTTDYLLIKSHILRKFELSETQKEKADVNGDGIIDGTDYILIKARFLGVKETDKTELLKANEYLCTDYDVINDIKAAYAKKRGIDWNDDSYNASDVWLEFLAGPFDGAYVAFIRLNYEAFTDNVWDWSAAGVTFNYYSGQELMFYKEGAFKTLRQAYADGDIADEDVKTVHALWDSRKNAGSKLRIVDPFNYVCADETVLNLIKADYAKKYSDDFRTDKINADDVIVRCLFGRFDGAYIAFLNYKYECFTANVWEWTAAGEKFVYHSGQELLYYRDGTFKTLRSVYESGEISNEDIKIIAYLWKNRAS